jgi:hypothetical protein
VLRTAMLAAAGALVLALAGSAGASWTPPRSVAAPYASTSAVAIDGRGDAVVAWGSQRRVAGVGRLATGNVAVRPAGGRLRARELRRSAHAALVELSAAIDGHGRITVAWVDWDPRKQVPSGVVRAAYGSIGGRFSRGQVVGKAGSDSGLALAAAPDGTVLMAWKARVGSRGVERDVVAWHRAGHRFGAVRRLSTSARAPLDLESLRAGFDAQGTAYVWGPCSASVLTAPAGARRFGRPLVLGERARGFSLSLHGAGRGVASWSMGRCSTGVMDAPEQGPVVASLLSSRAFSAPVAISSPQTLSEGATAIALPGGAGVVSFRSYQPGSYLYDLLAAPLSGGAFGPAQSAENRLAALSADARGNVLLEADTGSTYAPGQVVMRPSSGGNDEPAPVPPAVWPSAITTTAFARGAAVGGNTVAGADAPRQRLALSTWTP